MTKERPTMSMALNKDHLLEQMSEYTKSLETRIKELEDGIRKCANLERKAWDIEITEAGHTELCFELEEARKQLYKLIGIEE